MLPSVLVGHFSADDGADGWTDTGLHAAESIMIATNRKVKDEKYKKNTKKYGSEKKKITRGEFPFLFSLNFSFRRMSELSLSRISIYILTLCCK